MPPALWAPTVSLVERTALRGTKETSNGWTRLAEHCDWGTAGVHPSGAHERADAVRRSDECGASTRGDFGGRGAGARGGRRPNRPHHLDPALPLGHPIGHRRAASRHDDLPARDRRQHPFDGDLQIAGARRTYPSCRVQGAPVCGALALFDPEPELSPSLGTPPTDVSPAEWTTCSQLALEPILLDEAISHPIANVRFGVSFTRSGNPSRVCGPSLSSGRAAEPSR
jgi:hypothetical protein